MLFHLKLRIFVEVLIIVFHSKNSELKVLATCANLDSVA